MQNILYLNNKAMREIKFRVWDGIGYMSKPFTLNDLQSNTIQFTTDCVVMQFTGLKDKNEKEIYCHDIIHSLYSDGSSCSHIIKWVNSEARFMIFDLVTDRECGGISQGWINEHKKQVIGNIHESKINF